MSPTAPHLPRSEGVQYATREGWRAITNSSRKNGVTGPKRGQCSVVDASAGESEVQSSKEPAREPGSLGP